MLTDNLIAGITSAKGSTTLQSTNPKIQQALPEKFAIATPEEINEAVEKAHEAWHLYQKVSGSKKAVFLRSIAEQIEALGDQLIQRVMNETGLLEGRVQGECKRTCNQLRLFANLVEEGSWVEATIDKALPNRKPFPRVDIRKMLVSIGPVAVFTASNFPLAFSTAGGDTASALAAGCPVIVKAHPAHLGTNALVATAIHQAIEKCDLPGGIFSSIQGGISTGQQLVMHPLLKAVGFTGSYKGGKAIFDLANSRPNPIPVYAEMGSNNPIFLLPHKLQSEKEALATQIAASVNLGAGQFCTNPGILVLRKGEGTSSFLSALQNAFTKLPAQCMLNQGIFNAYESNVLKHQQIEGVSFLFEGSLPNEEWKAKPMLATVSAQKFLTTKALQEEVFGPYTLAVICDEDASISKLAEQLDGQLTATIFGTSEDLIKAKDLIGILKNKVGRLIFNGVPTGVEVGHAMHHGGPFPATTSSQFTSVGSSSIKRFVRPVSFQNAPDYLLPAALKTDNPLNIWRMVNGEKSKK